ncbi:restriction endonuclease subunit S [Streptococcus pneumoniae]|uniref:restriction endonuclease subunit S n=1 Tax=Streptococcus pneumoniae TaxID=1313 RepID=UPI0007758DCA|nr:restriction endonuclease subunit S [Streptococcus pneumoniae]
MVKLTTCYFCDYGKKKKLIPMNWVVIKIKDIFSMNTGLQLITPVSTSLEHIGKFARIDKDYDGVVAGGFIFQLTPFESSEIISKFLLFNLSSPLFYKQLKAITKLSGQALYNIPKTTLSELLIPLAPFEEQELITQKVEKLFEKVNQLWK